MCETDVVVIGVCAKECPHNFNCSKPGRGGGGDVRKLRVCNFIISFLRLPV